MDVYVYKLTIYQRRKKKYREETRKRLKKKLREQILLQIYDDELCENGCARTYRQKIIMIKAQTQNYCL